ncbi:MAG: hypothetical protein KGD63_14520 [Candidatus Lokiarchaeota archaeon]|nr:hypothetical protein [Candidatus Lokiarchaeota archaeon]
MPVRIRWISKDYFGILLMFFGVFGLLQTLLILIAQFSLFVSSYYVVIIIPFGSIIALSYGAIVIYESIVQVKKRKQLKSQFRKSKAQKSLIKKILNFPIIIPLVITTGVFISFFLIIYAITVTFLDIRVSFVIAEIIGAIILLLVANVIEKFYGKVRRY